MKQFVKECNFGIKQERSVLATGELIEFHSCAVTSSTDERIAILQSPHHQYL